MRVAEVRRKTLETDAHARVDIDGKGVSSISTGIGFFDHMLHQIAKHGSIDLVLDAKGDTHVDAHHTVEDCGYVFGDVILKALGDKVGICRYGYAYAPMDESLSRAVIDFSGRSHLFWNVSLPSSRVGSVDTEVFREFFLAFSLSSNVTLHIENLYGANTHHILESCFKAVALSLRKALAIDKERKDVLPTTKGAL